MAKKTAAPGGEKLNYLKTILIGFGFLGSSIAWQIYDPYVTKILQKFLTASHVVTEWSARLAGSSLLRRFIESQGNDAFAGGAFTVVPLLIGLIMTFDNVFGVIFQPYFGKLSDRTHSRLGKRRPFILFGAPISALLFLMIPMMNSLPAVMACVILFVFVMSLWRSPVVALMPDLTPSALRSEGNAVINLMGNVGGAIGLVAGSIVTAIFLAVNHMTKESEGYSEFATFPGVFAIGAVVMVVGMLVLMFFVKEKDSRLLSADVLASKNEAERLAAEKEAKRLEKEARKEQKLSTAERRSLLAMLGGLFFLFCASNAIQTFFALFAEEILHKDTSQATSLLMILAVASALAALPSGWVGKKLGRKKTILLGLGLFLGAFVIFFVVFTVLCGSMGLSVNEYVALNLSSPAHDSVTQMKGVLDVLVYPVLALAGIASMMITVNTLPLVLEIGGVDKVGTFTGYYYTATFSAQIASPIVYGFVRMFSGTYLSLFYYSPVAFALAFLLICFVKHGEAIPQEVIEQAEEMAPAN